MNQKQRDRQHQERLSRIVARLFSLADIAEATSRHAAPLCWLMLWILRPAEAFARRVVVKWARSMAEASPAARRWVGETGLASDLSHPRLAHDCAASELVALAQRMRDCAMAFQALAAIDEVCWLEDDLRAEWNEALALRALDVALVGAGLAGSKAVAATYQRPEVRAGLSPVPS